MVDWVSILFPVAYVGILVASLATFSSLYRRRKAARSLHLAPYFPPHTPRDIYLTLLHTDTPSKPPDSVLRSALLLRACENIRRILTIRTRKPALQTLLARGSVGDDLWQRLLRAERELEDEVRDVVNEANALANGWGQTIFQSANEMVNRDILNEKIAKIRESEEQDKKTWISTREERRANALKDLGAAADDGQHGLPVGGEKVSEIVAPQSVGGVTTGSDEDAVLVEADAANAAGGGVSTPGGGGGGGKKKKKGKK